MTSRIINLKNCRLCNKPIRIWQDSEIFGEIIKTEEINGVRISYWQKAHESCITKLINGDKN